MPVNMVCYHLLTNDDTTTMAHHPIVNTAITAARQAGDLIIQASLRLDEVQATPKGRHDFATQVDNHAEKIIIETLHTAYPEYGFICEESGKKPGNEYTWIVDPLDGTTNFVHGLPHFCVSIALKHNNRIEHGVIYDPIRQELFTASRGRGAQLNDRRIRVANRRNLDGALIGLNPIKHPKRAEGTEQLRQNIAKKAAGLRHSGSAALDLAYVAAGRLDAFIEWRLREWDIAAGVLLVQEAGGVVTQPNGDDDYLNAGNVLAANAQLTTALLQAIL